VPGRSNYFYSFWEQFLKCSWEEKLTPLLLGAVLEVLLGGEINSTPSGSISCSAPGRNN